MVVADDYEDILGQFRQQWRDAGFDASFVTTADDLVAATFGEQPDLVITDLAMAPRDGWSAIEEIRAVMPTLPVWALSAYSKSDLMNAMRAKELGVLLLQKPEDMSTLRARIEGFFGLARFAGDIHESAAPELRRHVGASK